MQALVRARRPALRSRAARVLALAVALAVAVVAAPAAGHEEDAPDRPGRGRLHLVTLAGPGLAADRDRIGGPLRGFELRAAQQAVLAAVGAPDPTYRWTTALNGFAVRLTATQAEELAARPDVVSVEPDTTRPLAGSPLAAEPGPAAALPPVPRTRGGAGVVVGVVDSGIDPESPLFSAVPGLGRRPTGFEGACEVGESWDADDCNGKVLGARWYVAGFGAERVRSGASLSPRDDAGHGTQVASVVAGNPGVTVRIDGRRHGLFAGTAPQARLAVYKACWSAPDPADDGCSTADLVTAVDDAVRDGVDVLTVAAVGSGEIGTLQRALLGAAEADVVVVAAAGNQGGRRFAGHVSPWVTTVGAVARTVRQGRVLGEGLALSGASATADAVGPAPVVVAAAAPAPGASAAAARVCAPGSLDAARVADAIVLCERGRVGRVDKSAAVRRADGVGMLLVNVRRGSVHADFHSVPTVHLDHAAGAALRRWLTDHPGSRLRLEPEGRESTAPTVTRWSAGGDPGAATLKPDVVAEGVGLLGAVPPTVRADRWDVLTGTSAAAARTAGVAALVRARHPGWPATTVRSAIAGSAGPVRASSLLRAGSGRVRAVRAMRPGLVHELDAGAYRAWLTGRRPDLNTPSVVLPRGATVARRTVTSLLPRARYFSVSVRGFRHHDVTVTPAALRLDPGERATYTIRVSGAAGGVQPLDDGVVVWRGATGTVTRVPVVLSR